MRQEFDLKKMTDSTKCRTKQAARFLLAAAALAAALPAYAQEVQGTSGSRPKTEQSADSEQFRFDIPPQSLSSALSSLGETSHLQILYDAALTQGLSTKGVSGTHTPKQALRILLDGTGLTARFADSGAVTLERAAAGKSMVLPELEVTGDWLGQAEEKNVLNHPGARQVVRREAFVETGAGTIVEALRDIPGIQPLPNTDSSVSSLSISVRGLTGRLTPRSTVLLDGVPLSVAPYGQPHLSLAPVALGNLDAIDVVKSGGAVRYGPQNVGGVINFVTREIPLKQELSTKIKQSIWPSAGSDGGLTNIDLFTGNSLDNGFGWALLYSGQYNDSFREHSETDVTNLILKSRYFISDTVEVSGRVNYYTAANELPGGLTQAEYDADPFQSSRPHDRFRGDRKEAVIKLLMEPDGHRQFELTTFYTDSFREFTLAKENEQFAGRLDRFPRNYKVFGMEPRYNYRVTFEKHAHELSVGYRYLQEKGREQRFRKKGLEAFGDPDALTAVINRDNANRTRAHAFYIDDRIDIGALSITPGVRFEQVTLERTNNLSGFEEKLDYREILPSVNIIYRLTPKTRMYANYNTSFSGVSFAQINRNEGDNDLNAERAQIYELGSRHTADTFSAEATVFLISFEDIIEYDKAADQYFNRGKTLHRGLEFSGNLDVGVLTPFFAGLELYANYTYTKATFEEGDFNGNDIPFYSRHIGTVGARYSTDSWIFNIDTYAQSEQFSDSANTKEDPVAPNASRSGAKGTIPGYGLVNARVNYRFENTKVSFGVKNLLDKESFYRGPFTQYGLYANAPREFYVNASVDY